MLKKNRTSVIVFLGTFSFLFVRNVEAQTLSFSEAYSVMHKENSLLKGIEKQKEAHQYTWKAEKGLRYPTVKAFGLGLYFNRKIGADLNDFRNGVGSFLQIPNPEVLGNWDLTFVKREMAFGGFMATWPLFTGGKINAAIKAGEIRKQIGEKEFENTTNKLISELAERYFQVKLAEEAVEVRKQVLLGVEHHHHNAVKLEENGIIAPVEKLQADVAVADANRELLAAEKDAKLARVALANTIEVDAVYDKLTTDFFITPQLESLEYYQEAAINNNPLLQKVELQNQLAEQGIRAKKSAYYPTVLAFGQTILVDNSPVGFGWVDHNDKPWVVGVGITYTLFEGLKNKNEIKAAKATKESVELLKAKAQKDIVTLIEKLYQEIQKHQEQITSLELQEQLATELVRVRNKAFLEGLAASTDVVDAEMNLSGVKLLKLKAHYDYATGLASLLEYAGLSNEFLQYTK